ncbi:MAG: class I SAM-dependent methyltransferase [Methanotrichaceae archaeon]
MEKHFLNTTDGYHKNDLDSLGWEVTLSLMLENPQSPCRSILKNKDSFGNLLYDFLSTIIPMNGIHCIIEIGGGYGYLMRDFLRRNNKLCATMIDLSPFLLEKQRETLRDFAVEFIQGDFFELGGSIFSNIDLVVLNEVIGDFPTACEVPREVLFECHEPGDVLLQEIRRIYKGYHLMHPSKKRLTLNLGAIQAIERLCTAQIPYIYVSEHSCEARIPEALARLLEPRVTGEPERIRLRGHDEYTVRFSDLESVASYFGYTSRRGQYIDFIEPIIDEEVTFILCLGSSKIDRHEIIIQFIEDLIKYEYLILSLPYYQKK